MNLHPPEIEEPGLSRAGLKADKTTAEYHLRRRLQASLATRANRMLSIRELMPQVYAVTLAQGFGIGGRR
jgi:hypothetical protein